MNQAYHKGLSDPMRAVSFMQAIGKAFTFDGHGSSVSDWIVTLRDLSPNQLVTIKMNGGQFVPYTGPAPDAREALNPISLDLLQAVREDTGPASDKVGNFIAQHPSWIAP
jgi:hypothetical protein